MCDLVGMDITGLLPIGHLSGHAPHHIPASGRDVPVASVIGSAETRLGACQESGCQMAPAPVLGGPTTRRDYASSRRL